MKYRKQENETKDEFIYRICELKDEIGSWQDVADIINSELDCQYNESAYRKKYQYAEQMFNVYTKKFGDPNSIDELRREKEEFKKERMKLSQERAEYNRNLREDAREELFLEKIIDAIKTTLKENKIERPTPKPILKIEDGKEAVLCIADMHFGKDFKLFGFNNEVINEYNPDIFYKRMWELFYEASSIIEKEGITKLKVFNLGDSLDGFLRHSQIWTLRYGVVESAIHFGNFMAEWLRALSERVEVEYHQTNGNHGELRLLDGKKNAHLNENIETITAEIIKIKNENNKNLTVVQNKSGFIFTKLYNYTFLGTHGEERDLEKAIKEYSYSYNTPIDYLFTGHKHHNNYINCGIRKGVIGIGSIVGTDEYAMKLRKSSDPSASLIIFDKDKGKKCEYLITL